MELQKIVILLAALAPFTLGLVVPSFSHRTAREAARLTGYGATICFLLVTPMAGWMVLAPFLHLPPSPPTGTPRLPMPIDIQLDGLTAVLLFTISSIGLVVSRFALRYLDADERQRAFSRWLAYTLTAVLTLVIAGNLVVFFLAWLAASHGLHRLLTLYPDRPAALLAARKKFFISRFGDVLLASAFVLIYLTLGSTQFEEIFLRADLLRTPEQASRAFWIGLLLVLGAMTKSAQFPFHTWLPETMESPSPVSALMHAGIINAGGVLLIRMSPVVSAAPAALSILAVLGAFTAVFGSVVMLTQNDVKKKLAFSTISQMGFMMLQCGVGAFAAATLHLVGHSVYKAHAFLSAGSWIDLHEPQPPLPATGVAKRLGPRDVLIPIAAGVALAAAGASVLGVSAEDKPGLWVLGGILSIGLAQLLMITRRVAALRPTDASPWFLGFGAGAGIALAYFLGVLVFEAILGDAVAYAAPEDVNAGIATLLVLALFVTALLIQAYKPDRQASPFWARFYVHAHQGFYLSALQNRIVTRLWPLPEPAPRAAR
jgi:NAD(P)H-quinone oxidoreductase subunit 5